MGWSAISRATRSLIQTWRSGIHPSADPLLGAVGQGQGDVDDDPVVVERDWYGGRLGSGLGGGGYSEG